MLVSILQQIKSHQTHSHEELTNDIANCLSLTLKNKQIEMNLWFAELFTGSKLYIWKLNDIIGIMLIFIESHRIPLQCKVCGLYERIHFHVASNKNTQLFFQFMNVTNGSNDSNTSLAAIKFMCIINN